MRAIALSRNSINLGFATLVVLAAIGLRTSTADKLPLPDVRTVSHAEAIALVDAGAVVIDVRDRAVSASAHLPGALLIPLETLAAQMKDLPVAKDAPIVVYCGDGTTRGPRAAHMLNQAGYTDAVNMQPGMEGWRQANYPVASQPGASASASGCGCGS